jgi:hypothetical protein
MNFSKQSFGILTCFFETLEEEQRPATLEALHFFLSGSVAGALHFCEDSGEEETPEEVSEFMKTIRWLTEEMRDPASFKKLVNSHRGMKHHSQ